MQENTETLAGDEDGWQLILVNEDHPLDSSYEPEKLTEISPGYEVDNRIVSDLRQMLDDGAAEGLSMYVTSAYRSYEQQTQTFNASMQNRLNQKMTPLKLIRRQACLLHFRGRANMRPALPWISFLRSMQLLMTGRGIRRNKNGLWNIAGIWVYSAISAGKV